MSVPKDARFERMTPLACETCGTGVLVRKSAPEQTAIQWNQDSASCSEFAGLGSDEFRAVSPYGCVALADTINAAYLAGTISSEF